MDGNTDVSEVQRSVDESYPFRALKRIPLVESYQHRVQWLWEHLRKQDYAFDDFSRNNVELFAQSLFAPRSEHFEFGDQGYACARDIIPRLSATIHFATWDAPPVHEVVSAGRELIRYLFTKYELRRASAFVPSYNTQTKRFATLLGFRFEGELRKAILSHGAYYNVGIYGLLREEFEKKEVHH